MLENKPTRTVVLPAGKWLADDGKSYKGGKSYEISVPLDRLPYFSKVK
jgi:alpha-glucosidase